MKPAENRKPERNPRSSDRHPAPPDPGRRRFLARAAAGGLVTLVPGAAFASAEKLFLRVRVSLPEDRGRPEPISFGLVADTHSGDLPDTDRPRYFRSSLGNLEETVQLFNQQNLDFAVHLGDVIQESGNRTTSITWLREMDEVFRQFHGPIHYAGGNHDFVDLSKNDFLAATSSTFRAHHYYFDRGGYRFVVVDANYRQDGTAYNQGNFHWTDTFLPQEQVGWLERTLERAKRAGLPVIVFAHQTFDETSQNHVIKNAAAVRDLFESKGNVAAVFYGHRHAGGYFHINGIHYVGLVATVNGPDKAAGIVRIPGDGTIQVEGIGERQPTWGPFPAAGV